MNLTAVLGMTRRTVITSRRASMSGSILRGCNWGAQPCRARPITGLLDVLLGADVRSKWQVDTRARRGAIGIDTLDFMVRHSIEAIDHAGHASPVGTPSVEDFTTLHRRGPVSGSRDEGCAVLPRDVRVCRKTSIAEVMDGREDGLVRIFRCTSLSLACE
ncbi:hypothetical protein ACQQ2N_10410 [Dokdonella sp. MW10]|uniref:hypothetical protein n=1 Tax=Dokdonella sp. MW10 TaxID=2992926 RepID=UPI003F7FC54C